MVLKKLSEFEEKMGLPSFRQGVDLLAGPTGRRIENILGHVEKLSADPNSVDRIMHTMELLKLIQEMDKQGTLARLESLMKALPKGKSGEAMLAKMDSMMKELGPRLDKLVKVADALTGP